LLSLIPIEYQTLNLTIAFEKHHPIKLLLKKPPGTPDPFDSFPLLPRVSHFLNQKMEQRTTYRQLRLFTLQIKRHQGNTRLSDNALHSPHETLPLVGERTLNVGPESLFSLTSHTDRPCGEHANTDKNLVPSSAMISPRCSKSARDKSPLPRRSTLCGTPFATATSLDLASSDRLNDSIEPPLTPLRQIIRTPMHPPRVERYGLRTPPRGQRASTGGATPFVGFCRLKSNSDFPDTPSDDIGETGADILSRDRPSSRRLSYPHFQIAPSSYSFSPLKMPSPATAFSGCQELASPLNIRSSNHAATPCTPQIVEGNPPHLQWSPHCLGCFA
jgi:hypothetical protein